MDLTNDAFNEAIILFIGHGINPYPQEDGSRLLNKFGPILGPGLEVKVKKLLKEVDEFKPNWNTQSLVSAGKWAVDEIQKKHPELNQDALDAIFWTYTYGYK